MFQASSTPSDIMDKANRLLHKDWFKVLSNNLVLLISF